MKVLFFNLLVIMIVGSPLLILELSRSRSKWVDEHHTILSLALWFTVLLAVYIWVLPMLGLEPNQRFFGR